ncbi:MAG: hypothetical protein CO113_08370, partial [Elusimicrobia bacterium CG_4_9_14_3_um_filter_62_55]
MRNGGDPFSLQAILGHSTLEMVRNYVSIRAKITSHFCLRWADGVIPIPLRHVAMV